MIKQPYLLRSTQQRFVLSSFIPRWINNTIIEMNQALIEQLLNFPTVIAGIIYQYIVPLFSDAKEMNQLAGLRLLACYGNVFCGAKSLSHLLIINGEVSKTVAMQDRDQINAIYLSSTSIYVRVTDPNSYRVEIIAYSYTGMRMGSYIINRMLLPGACHAGNFYAADGAQNKILELDNKCQQRWIDFPPTKENDISYDRILARADGKIIIWKKLERYIYLNIDGKREEISLAGIYWDVGGAGRWLHRIFNRRNRYYIAIFCCPEVSYYRLINLLIVSHDLTREELLNINRDDIVEIDINDNGIYLLVRDKTYPWQTRRNKALYSNDI